MELLIEIVKITLPAGLVMYGMYLVIKAQVSKELDKVRLEVRGKSIETVLPNRLHAYERMTLFLERISPQNLMMRLNDPQYSARELQQILFAEIRNEYNHNLSQQLYMSEEIWDLIKTGKEDLILTINLAVSSLEEEANSTALSKAVIDQYLAKDIDPIAFALVKLKEEIRQTF